MDGTVSNGGFGIAVDTSGNVYTTGHFSGSVDFDPGAGTAFLTSAGTSYDVFVSKLVPVGGVGEGEGEGGPPPVVTVISILTNDSTPELNGTIDDPNATIRVTVGIQTNHPAVNNGDGTWTLPDNTLSSSADGTHDVEVAATNALGDIGTDATTDELTIDTTGPSVFIGSPSPSSTTTGPVTYTVTYSGADSTTLSAEDVTLETTGTATGTISISGTGVTPRVVTIENITGEGTISISIAAGTAQDLAGNVAPAPEPAAPFDVISDTDGEGEGEVIDTCGILVQGVECTLFQTDDGAQFSLSNYGDFIVGQRVMVRGIYDPSCVTFCGQGQAAFWITPSRYAGLERLRAKVKTRASRNMKTLRPIRMVTAWRTSKSVNSA